MGPGTEAATADRLSGDLGEPVFDLIEPGTAGRNDVQLEARMRHEPAAHGGSLVGRVVVEHQVEGQPGGGGGGNALQKIRKRPPGLAGLAVADDPPGCTSRAANNETVPWRKQSWV